jgi:hypothetical protein
MQQLIIEIQHKLRRLIPNCYMQFLVSLGHLYINVCSK